MSRLAVALGLALLVLAPGLASASDAPLADTSAGAFPPEVRALVARWITDAQALGANDTARAWYPQAQGFLDNASAAHAQGRERTAMLDIETYTELTLANQIMDQAANLSSDADRRTFAISRCAQWNDQSSAAWTAYRAKLHRAEGDIASLLTLELAMYSADEALGAGLSLDAHGTVVREFTKAGGFSRDYVLSLVRADHTPLLDLQWASDLLDAASQHEGLPPKLVAENWTLITNASLADPGYGDSVPTQLQALEKLGKDVRAANESIMAVMINLGELRADRAQNIEIIFGDAQSRGKDVVRDAAHGMTTQLHNTTFDLASGYGLQGMFTADARDRAIFTNEFVARGQAQMTFIIAAWSDLDHQEHATRTLGAASPQQPAPVVTSTPHTVGVPAGGVAFALGAALAAAVLLTRRR